ncbi:MAG TPA: cation:proton antiporter [Sphingomonadaceae bacterium]|nr:cation:proton antiporter [Sphingomonadaceae bacterium]
MASGLASPALSDALVILGAAGIVIPAFARLRVSPIIGFILVGILVGPAGLGRFVAEQPWLYYITISDPHAIEPFAEFGIIMLLFSIGLELSFRRLWTMRRQVFGLGAAELFLSAVLIAGGLAIAGQGAVGAVALGLALALSSTALVLPIAGTQSPVGRMALAMLLFEDLAIVPIIFLLGALAPTAMAGSFGFWETLLAGSAAIAVMLLVGRRLLPRLFAQAARAKSPELFLSASLLVVIGASLVTTAVGLSPILGALIAGILIAETDYHNEVGVVTAPFKGLALGVFLISVGMSLDLQLVYANLPMLLLAIAGVVVVKTVVTGLLLRLTGARAGVAAETGFLMASPSETTLIVLATAAQAGLIDPGTANFWQVVTAIGLTLTPLLAIVGRRASRRIDHAGHDAPVAAAEGAVVIVGFGRVGRMVATLLDAHGRAWSAVETDPDAAAAARSEGFAVSFGDAARMETLDRMNLNAAGALVLTMDDPVLGARLTRRARAAFPDLTIIARARDSRHAAELYRAGASDAVPETLESSLQLSEAVLVDLGVAMGPVIASIHEKRADLRREIMELASLEREPVLKRRRLSDGDGAPAA